MPKRKKPFAANNASRKMLEADGWTVGVVEQRIPHTFITRDLYGFADLQAMSPSRGIMLIQATGGGNMAARVDKVRSEARHAIWLASGGRIQVHCWVKRAGKKQRECRILEITKTATQERNEELESINKQLFETRSTTAQAMVYQSLLMEYKDTQAALKECGEALQMFLGDGEIEKEIAEARKALSNPLVKKAMEK